MMKFGCHYSFWQNNTGNFSVDEYVGMTNRLADCGFDVMEISADHLYHMSEEGIARLRAEGEKRGMEFSTNSGPSPQYNLASPDEAIRANGTDYFLTILDHMVQLGSKVLIGAIYSFWPTDFVGWEDKAGAWERSIACLKTVGARAGELGITIALEILNRNETFILTDHKEAIEYCRRIDEPAVKILLDTYHMNIEEDNICDAIRTTANAGLLAHMHVSENNRKLPGMNNSLDWAGIGKTLREVSYDHYIVMEPSLLQGGSVGRDFRIFRDLSDGADEARMTELITNSLIYLKKCFLGL